jgi:hypothetical protein
MQREIKKSREKLQLQKTLNNSCSKNTPLQTRQSKLINLKKKKKRGAGAKLFITHENSWCGMQTCERKKSYCNRDENSLNVED